MFDKIIFGAGLYGLYAALKSAQRGENVLVLERDDGPFRRATYINQARVHMGYHYPRSYSTAIKSAHYFERFCEEYSFCIHSQFNQVYATGANLSWTSAVEFEKFCKAANILCEQVSPSKYFNAGLCDGAFYTKEYTYDAKILCDYFIDKIKNMPNVTISYGERPTNLSKLDKYWRITTNCENVYETPYILNATYASVNEIHKLIGADNFKIKYELCEIILCTVSENLKNTGITVMDGPFFSLMPFGKTGLHSLTSVAFTPHQTSYDNLPTFACQKSSGGVCTPGSLYNCNDCIAKPQSAFPYMQKLAQKFIKSEYEFNYKESLFSMKPILKASEIDDSRPTVVRTLCAEPKFVSVLSGKINTVYDLDEVL